jgi:hypothetical protein
MPRKSKGTRVNGHHKPQTLPAKFKAGFLSELDKRTDLARALRTNYDDIVLDIGGVADVGHVKAALIERFVWLEAILQTLEHEMAQGKIDKGDALGKWIQAVNSLSGLGKVLGVERKARSMPWLALPAPAGNANGNGGQTQQEQPANGNGNIRHENEEAKP